MRKSTRIEKMLKTHLGEGVEVSPLGGVIEKIIDYRGIAPPKSASGVMLITARNIREGFLDFTNKEYIPEDEFTGWMRRGLPKAGDLLFTTEAPMGNVAIFPEGKFALGQRVVSIRPKKAVLNSGFLKNYLLSNIGRFQLYLRATGSTAQGIKASELRKLPVPLLPVVLQEKINRTIEHWERAIDVTENLIATKQERRTWLMQQLLTGKRRLAGFSCSQESRKTNFGPLPGDWDYPRIGGVAREVSERNGGATDRPVLSCTKHQGLVDSLSYFGKRIFSEDLSTYKVVRRDQFAYATNHIDEGSIGYQDQYVNRH